MQNTEKEEGEGETENRKERKLFSLSVSVPRALSTNSPSIVFDPLLHSPFCRRGGVICASIYLLFTHAEASVQGGMKYD